MKILTDESLAEAVKLCYENEYYRVLIVTQYAEDHLPILDKLDQYCVDVVRCKGHPWAKFRNGSIINLISLAANMCGRRANLVLCQVEVYNNYEEMRYILPTVETTNKGFEFLRNQEVQEDAFLF